ncbi:MAG TPA: hypothetical protein DDY77_02600 [Clostridiales bacterium]|nr:hypothetical protein [Clostridiales bacterium]
MAEIKKYSYAVEGEIDGEKLVERVKALKNVADAKFENGTLTYFLPENADEYDVLVSSMEICTEMGAELIIGDDEEEKKEEVDVYEQCSSVEEIEENLEKEEKTAEGKADESAEFSSADRIVEAKKTLKKESLVRAIELAVAVAFMIAALFVPSSNSVISLKTIFSVLAFAVGGYEIFYSAIVGIFKKKIKNYDLIVTISCLFGAFFGYITEITVFIVIYAIADEVAKFADNLSAVTLDEIFYTGSVPLTLENGEKRSVEAVVKGDKFALERYDVVPADGVALTDGKVDAYRAEGVYEKLVKAGDKVLAGSVVLSDGLKFEAETTSKESALSKKKESFSERTEFLKRDGGKLFALDLALILASLVCCFVLPIFAENYAAELTSYVGICVSIMLTASFSLAAAIAAESVYRAVVVAKYRGIDFGAEKAFYTLANANSIVVRSSVLTENGTLKADSLGALKELYFDGAKNVTTEFDCAVEAEDKEKIDLVDKAFKGEKKVFAGGDGEVSFQREKTGEKVVIENGEIFMLPLAYSLAKKAVKREKRIKIISPIVKGACIIAAMFVPATILSPVYFACVSAAATLAFTLSAFSSASVKE